MTGQKHTATGDRLADERSVHAAQSLPKGPETVSLRDALIELYEAAQVYFDGYCQDEAAVDGPEFTGCSIEQHQAARRLRDALDDTSADEILSLLPPKGWRPIEVEDLAAHIWIDMAGHPGAPMFAHEYDWKDTWPADGEIIRDLVRTIAKSALSAAAPVTKTVGGE